MAPRRAHCLDLLYPMLVLPLLLVAAPAATPPCLTQELGQLLEPQGVSLPNAMALDANGGRVAVSWVDGAQAQIQIWTSLPGTGDLTLEDSFDGPPGLTDFTSTLYHPNMRFGPDGQVVHGVLGGAIHAYRPDGSGGWDLQELAAPVSFARNYGVNFDIDVDARRMVVATEMFSSQFEYALAVYYLAPGSDLWALEDVITEPRVSSGGAALLDVAMDDGLIVLGHQSGFGTTSGAVSLYRQDASGNIVAAGSLTRSGSVLEHFGITVEIEGDHIAIGSRRNNATGMITAYRRDGAGGWEDYQQFNHPEFQPNDRFGTSVRMSGDLMVVGGPWVDTSSAARGIAEVRRFNGSSWARVTTLRDGIAAPGDSGSSNFGRLVAADASGSTERAITIGSRDFLGSSADFAWAEDVAGSPALERPVSVTAGVSFCEPSANSTSRTARLRCLATSDVSATNFWGFRLEASSLPASSFAIFTIADHLEPSPIGPFGLLCARAPAPWRLSAPLISDADGIVSATASPFAFPIGSASVSATAGSTWTFQTLARDGGGVTATNAVAFTFR